MSYLVNKSGDDERVQAGWRQKLKKGLQDGSKTCSDVCIGDCGTDKRQEG